MHPMQNFEIFHLRWVPGPDSLIFFQKTFKFLDMLGVKNGKKVKCLMKWVRIAPNLEILIPIDAPQVWDLKNAGFGNFLKIHSSFFGSFLPPRIPRLGPYWPTLSRQWSLGAPKLKIGRSSNTGVQESKLGSARVPECWNKGVLVSGFL